MLQVCHKLPSAAEADNAEKIVNVCSIILGLDVGAS